MLSSQSTPPRATEPESSCPPLLRKKQYLPFPMVDLPSEDVPRTDPSMEEVPRSEPSVVSVASDASVVYHTPMVRRKRPLQEQQPTTSSLSLSSSSTSSICVSPPRKSTKVEPEYDIQDEAAAVMTDLKEGKILSKITQKGRRKKLKWLMEKTAMQVVYKSYLLTKETEDPKAPMKSSEEFEMEMKTRLPLIFETQLDNLKPLLQKIVCNGYLVINNFYNGEDEPEEEGKQEEEGDDEDEEEDDMPPHTDIDDDSVAVLQAMTESDLSHQIIQEDCWNEIKAFMEKIVAFPSYEMYLLYKAEGIYEAPMKSEKEFASDMRTTNLLPSIFSGGGHSKLFKLINTLICKGYVAIDQLYRSIEQYEQEEEENVVIIAEDKRIFPSLMKL